ncbi:hypothetical protein T484DRAFT_1628518 [Baffinella frigidus]|nr:hypothetical protein T484DRAFT_1628518 [Cryptophyta sp. CCMP2293]
MYLPVCPPPATSTHQSNNPTIQQFNNPTIQQSNNPTIQQSNNLTMQQSNNPTIQHSDHPTIPCRMTGVTLHTGWYPQTYTHCCPAAVVGAQARESPAPF